MPEISKRGHNQSDSPIRNLSPFAHQAKLDGKHVHHLNIGQPDIPTPLEAIKAIQKYNERIIPYGKSEGELVLRQSIADYYQKFQGGLRPEDVLVCSGASEAIQLLMHTCFDLDDEFIVPDPFYANYYGYAQMCGINIRPVSSSLTESFALPGIEHFEAQINAKTKAIFLCNPGNPTGILYTEEELKQIGALAKQHDLFLFVDEVYAEFCYENEFCSALSLEGLEEHVVVIGSISKVFSSCGARVGYLLTKNGLLKTTILKYAQIRLSAPMLGQHLAVACYKHFDSYFPPVLAEYRKRRDVIYEYLSQMEGIICYKPQAAFYNMVQLPVANSFDFCKWLLTSFEHKGETVMFAPGGGFYLDKEKGKQQVRMAFVLAPEKIVRAMECLEIALKQYAK